MPRFIAPNGSDRNPGTVDLPWATVQKANLDALPGEIVYVRDGAYVEQEIKGGPLRTKPIVFRPYKKERPVFTHAGNGFGLNVENAGRITFDRLLFRGRVRVRAATHHVRFQATEHDGQGIAVYNVKGVTPSWLSFYRCWIHDLAQQIPLSGSPVGSQAGYGLEVGGCDHLHVTRCRFEDCDDDAITGGGLHDAWIVGNWMTDILPGHDPKGHCDGVQIFGSSKKVRILDNLMQRVGQGVIVKGVVGNPGTNVYEDFVIAGNVIDQQGKGSNGLNLYDVDGLALVHNTVLATLNGIRLSTIGGTEPNRLRNAVILNNIATSAGWPAGAITREGHNLILSPAKGFPYDPSDLLSRDPQLGTDYRPLPDSIVRGGGVRYPGTRFVKDRLGVDRPDPPDIGAMQS